MKFRKSLLWLVMAAIVVASFMGASDKPGVAQSASGLEGSVQSKLNEIIQNQKSIMADLAAIREELRIVKIRVTQAQ